jgi:phosphate transport system substrate-binding protein
MKLILSSLLFLAGVSASAAKHQITGSDTMAGLMTDAIVASGMDQIIGYVGGGSGVGEKSLVAGETNVTAMSRPLNVDALQKLRDAGVDPVEHVIALDGLSIFVHQSNLVPGMNFTTLAKIFTFEVTNWNQVAGSGKVGVIKAFRRNDQSGTTDTFKSLVGVKKFGDCITVVNETVDIAEYTARLSDAIGYAGESAHKEGNRSIGIAKSGENYVLPLTTTIRDGSYPLARKLFVYEATGSRSANQIERQFLDQILDRSFMDPIVQDHDFITLD